MLPDSKTITQLKILELQASLLKFYAAPWLKTVTKVGRVGGKFASESTVAKQVAKAAENVKLPGEAELAKANIVAHVPQDGSGTSTFFKTQVDGQNFFMKQVMSERTISSGREKWVVRSPFGAEREEIGNKVARLFGLDKHVIPTKKVELNGNKYTIAPDTPGDPFWEVHGHHIPLPQKAKFVDAKLGDNAKKGALFDFLMDNRDRHAGNIYITKDADRTAKLIDHEFILKDREPNPYTPPLAGIFNQWIKGRHKAGNPVKFTEDELKDAISKRDDILKIIQEHLPEDEVRAAKKVLSDRLDYLKQMIDNKSFDALQLTHSAQEKEILDQMGMASATKPMNFKPASATKPMNNFKPASATESINQSRTDSLTPALSNVRNRPASVTQPMETETL
jgi:hypothetical protein